MDKFRLLQEFAKHAAEKSLALDQVRLYLLLLAACGEQGRGSVDPETVGRALGRAYLPADLRRAARALARKKLIEIIALPETEEAPMLSYRLLPIGEEEA